MDKETYSFMYVRDYFVLVQISDHAMQWLCGTTTDDNGRQYATSHCLATSWQGWLLLTVRPKVSTDRLCFQSVKHSIPRNSFQRNGTWAGSAYAVCWTNWQSWNS